MLPVSLLVGSLLLGCTGLDRGDAAADTPDAESSIGETTAIGATSHGSTDGEDPTGGETGASMTGGATAATTGATAGGPVSACVSLCGHDEVYQGDLVIGPGDSTEELVCVTRVAGGILIEGAIEESALAGLSSLQKVDGRLRIFDNPVLTGLAPFACLREVGAIDLSESPALADVSALSGLTALGEFGAFGTAIASLPVLTADDLGLHLLELANNSALVDLDALTSWTTNGGVTVHISHEPTLASIAGLSGLPTYSVWIEGVPQLASLVGLETLVVAGDLVLLDLPLISDLGPLAQLEQVYYYLVLSGMPLVDSLQPLGNLTRTDVLALGGCINGGPDAGGMDGLTSLAGLDALTQVGALGIANCANLSSLAGAPALTRVDDLELVANPQLPDAAVTKFLAQIHPPPEQQCVGDWTTCSCFFYEVP